MPVKNERLKQFAVGNELFQKNYFKNHEEHLLRLVREGQNPRTLFIGCSDSRVIPDLIVQTRPGDLFVVRNVGNFVAPYRPDNDFHSTASAIEYAIGVLKVSEIIICGTHLWARHPMWHPLDETPREASLMEMVAVINRIADREAERILKAKGII